MSQTIANALMFKGRIFDVIRKEIAFQKRESLSISTIVRDVVIKNPVVVCLVHNTDTEEVILVREYRAGSNSIEVGFVAGIVDDGEEPIQAAIRETIEETGYVPYKVEYLGATNTSAGFTNERVHHFHVKVKGNPSAQDLDNDEEIEVITRPLFDIESMLTDGTIEGNHAHATVLKAALIGSLKLNG